MITPSEVDYIKSHAHVPEHITNYVIAISGGEPFLFNDYLYYKFKSHLLFIGYPFKDPFNEKVLKEALDNAVKSIKPEHVTIIAPEISVLNGIQDRKETDSYYKLSLPGLNISQKLRNMINRASRELCIEKKQEMGDEHIHLISEFLSSHRVGDDTRSIFEKIPKYIASVSTAWIFTARDKNGRLAGFDIAEFGAEEYAFYMFNFMSREWYVPGASDLLLYGVVKEAREQGKPFINLGLGINKGIILFKKKWGGIPFLDHKLYFYRQSHKDNLNSLFNKL